MRSAARIGVAGIGLTSPLGEDLEGSWDRLIAGHGAVQRMAFDGLADIAAAPVAADVSQVLQVMEEHRIRRLPVTGSRRLADMITEADVARNLPDESVAEFAEEICADF